MKAPDKCYITREKNGVVYSLSFNDNGGLEYIRKDALMEYLAERKKHYQGLIPAEGAVAFICAFDEVKYKIESL